MSSARFHKDFSFDLVRRPTRSPLDQFVERPLVAGPCLQPSLKTGPLRNERFVGNLRSFIAFRSADQDEAIAFLISQRLEHCPALVIELTSPRQPSRGPARITQAHQTNKNRLDLATVPVASEHVRVDGLRRAGKRTFDPPNASVSLQQVTLMLATLSPSLGQRKLDEGQIAGPLTHVSQHAAGERLAIALIYCGEFQWLRDHPAEVFVAHAPEQIASLAIIRLKSGV